jgi:phosphoenolpyruvate---glycerone phosphotransferase subunit DhaK
MLDAACPGQIFTSPTPNQMMNAAQSVDGGAGVLFIVKNYSGDMMNFQMAAEMLDQENAVVIVNDDVAVEDSTYTTGRRGVAGTLIVEKILGAAAERGDNLQQLKILGDAVNKATASMGVALTSCTVPAAGKPTFQISMNEMEVGVGIHGEPGRRRVPLASADSIAEELTGAVVKDLGLKTGQEVILLVNGFGGTPVLELYLMVNATRKVLAKSGVTVARYLTGSYVTSLEMAGCSLTATVVTPEFLSLWDAPVHTAALRWGM